MPEEPKSLFLSHSSRDRAFCERLALDLTRVGVPVWYDDWELKVGDSLRRKISDGIESRDHLAVVLSDASVKSDWVQVELNAALDRELKERKVIVLPLLIQDCDIPAFLRDKKYADFRTDYPHGLGQLLEVLGVSGAPTPILAQSPSTTRRRDDELAMDAADFAEWFTDLLETGNSVKILRFMRNWAEDVAGVSWRALPNQQHGQRVDLDERSIALLERLTTVGNLLVRLEQEQYWGRLIDGIYEAYLAVNSWGLGPGGSVDFNVTPSHARCTVLDVVFVLGAIAMDAGRYELLRPLIERTTPGEHYWAARGWFRYTLTMAARSDTRNAATWYLPTNRAIEYLRSHSELLRDFGARNEPAAAVAQFDLIQAIYWVLHSTDTLDRLKDSYSACALLPIHLSHPTIRDLIRRSGPAMILGDYSDTELADILIAFANTATQSAFGRTGWQAEGWMDPNIEAFVKQHATPSA
jgi:TIR domain